MTSSSASTPAASTPAQTPIDDRIGVYKEMAEKQIKEIRERISLLSQYKDTPFDNKPFEYDYSRLLEIRSLGERIEKLTYAIGTNFGMK
jgi:hypothetical protein